jgi:hypothetical protein
VSRRGIIDIQNLAGETYLITGLKKGVVVIQDAEADLYGPSYRAVIEVRRPTRSKVTKAVHSASFYRLSIWVEDLSEAQSEAVDLYKAKDADLHALAKAAPSKNTKQDLKSAVQITVQRYQSFQINDGGEIETQPSFDHGRRKYSVWKGTGLRIMGKIQSSYKGHPILDFEAGYKASQSSKILASKKIKSRIPMPIGKLTNLGQLKVQDSRKERGSVTGIKKVPIIGPFLTHWGRSKRNTSLVIWARLDHLPR